MAASFDTTLAQVRAARGGDRAALEALFARYLGWVVDTVALRLGRRRIDCQDLEDIAQESLLDAFRSLDRFEHRSEGSFRHWLASIVEHNVIDAARRQQAGKRAAPAPGQAPATQVPSRDATPSHQAGQHEAAELVERALLQLPARSRELLVLRDRCGMSFEEVAAAAGLGSAESARTSYRRALQELAAALQAVGQRR